MYMDMSYFWSATYGPGFLGFFVDLFFVFVILELIALLVFTGCMWKLSSNGNLSTSSLVAYENPVAAAESAPKGTGLRETKSFQEIGTQTVPTTDITENADDGQKYANEKSTSIQNNDFVQEDVFVFKSSYSSTSNHDQHEHQPRSRPNLERRKSRDDIVFQSGWRKTVKLLDLIKANVIRESRVLQLEHETITEEEVEKELKPYLIGKYPIAGIYNDVAGCKMSLYDAYKDSIISRGTALSLLEAQAAVGSIIDPHKGSKMGVADALQQELLDKNFAAVLFRAERAVTGYKVKDSNEKLSLFQAMQKGLVVEKHGIRLLEAQIATGGIIDPVANHRLPVEVAFERGLFNERLHRTLEDPTDDTKGFLDPNTKENLTYLELLERCVEDPDTELLLLPLVRPEEKKYYKGGHLEETSIRTRMSVSKSRTISSSSTEEG
uniref:desmoplakin-like isoform X2 n=1 Tax=Ciona intestinalis TaxID=7719 RepID=UPI00089DAB77|nr:desmoplakin-like isoform X2 [Ciona intestinalis]|eukprot:XP_018670703.1 desmoplakin-like isoform X2 [Ciona intestinalis]